MRAFLCLFVKHRTSDHKHLGLFWSKTVLFSLLSGWFTLTSSNTSKCNHVLKVLSLALA